MKKDPNFRFLLLTVLVYFVVAFMIFVIEAQVRFDVVLSLDASAFNEILMKAMLRAIGVFGVYLILMLTGKSVKTVA